MEHKVLTPELKMLGDDSGPGSFSGYASTFANWDSVNERPTKGAFTKHLPAFLKDGFIAIGHDWTSLPAATLTDAYEDDHGLYIAGDFHSTPEAQKARTVIKERIERGKSVKLSIGYEVLQDEYTQEGRLLKEVKLYETSFVNVPANPAASVLASKDGAVSALPLEVHSETVVSAAEELVTRLKANHEARVKEGRVLSERNRKRIMTLLESLTSIQGELSDLLASTEPKADPETLKHLYAEYLLIQAQLNGVKIQ